MLEIFTIIGLVLVAFGVIFGLTALCGWLGNDDDYTLRWVFSCLIAAGLATALVLTNIH